MKITIKLILLIAIVLNFTATSCVKGDKGDPGINGVDGIAGQNGTNGANGTDGNANVIASGWTDINFSASWDGNDEASFVIADENITEEVVDTYALLGFTRFSSSSSTSASAMPFISLGQQYEIHNAMRVGNYVVNAFVNDEIARPVPPTNHQVRYVLIAPSSTTGKSSTPSLEQMKSDGVNVNNYKEVMDYFGLEH